VTEHQVPDNSWIHQFYAQAATVVSATRSQLIERMRAQHSFNQPIAATPNANWKRSGNRGNRRRLCFVTETYPPEINGVALTISRLIKELVARGHAVSLIRPHQPGFDSDATDSSLTLVRGVPLPGYSGLQLGMPAGALLKRLWTRQRPDVVYVATEGPLGWSAVRVARRLGIATLSGFHTNYHSYFSHYRLGCLQSLVFRYLRRLHNGTRGTMVASLDLRDHLEALGFKNVTFLARGVDISLFAPERRCAQLRRRWGLKDDQLAVIYVGRIAPEKNLPLAIEAYHAMHQVDNSLKFILVGDGPLYPILQKQHPNLLFCGVQTGEALARHYASADIFLFPSETETFGNVTLEAMASGLAVVAYNYAAAKLHIKHDETGLLVPCGDSRAFIESAVLLAGHPHLLHKLRTQAREYTASLDWSHVVEMFESWLTGTPATNRALPAAAGALAVANAGRLQ
jgi:glycosyltransferase involved in cell wall biosynthesis